MDSIWKKLATSANARLGEPLSKVAAAFAAVKSPPRKPDDRASQDDVTVVIGVIALGVKMARADGFVTHGEVAAFDAAFKVPADYRANVARAFDVARAEVVSFHVYAKQLARLFDGRPEYLEDILDGLFHIAKADHDIHPAELKFLASVASLFGFGDNVFDAIKARHLSPGDSDPYIILGLSGTATDDDIRVTYDRLVGVNQRAALSARGVPPELLLLADLRLAAIKIAYRRIARERGYNGG